MVHLLPDPKIGIFRNDVAEIIPLHSTKNAYTATELINISKSPYLSARKRSPLMKFKPQQCEDRPTSGPVNPFFFKVHPTDDYKICGDLTMASENEVSDQMDFGLPTCRKVFDLSDNPGSLDILELAARVQQWFVVVHPFIDGNGRLSRLFMDMVLQQAHLPPPILEDMNQDFFTNINRWSTLIGQGILNTVEAMEACADDPTRLGCKVVSRIPP